MILQRICGGNDDILEKTAASPEGKPEKQAKISKKNLTHTPPFGDLQDIIYLSIQTSIIWILYIQMA